MIYRQLLNIKKWKNWLREREREYVRVQGWEFIPNILKLINDFNFLVIKINLLDQSHWKKKRILSISPSIFLFNASECQERQMITSKVFPGY